MGTTDTHHSTLVSGLLVQSGRKVGNQIEPIGSGTLTDGDLQLGPQEGAGDLPARYGRQRPDHRPSDRGAVTRCSGQSLLLLPLPPPPIPAGTTTR